MRIPIGKKPRDYRTLLGALCALAFVYPLLDHSVAADRVGVTVWFMTFWVMLALALRTLRLHGNLRKVCWLFLGLAIAVGGLGIFYNAETRADGWHTAIAAGVDAFSLLVLSSVTVIILRDVLSAGRVDANRMWGAVCVYVLIGLMWTFLYGFASLVSDHSLVPSQRFPGAESPTDVGWLGMRLYFSFVTLTTVGYGDIGPGNPLTRLLATAEAVTGQLYLAILVARMVGLSISPRDSSRADPSKADADSDS